MACWNRTTGSERLTLVVTVATGVRLEVDTQCLLWARAHGNADLVETDRQGKEPRHQVLTTRFQGSFDRWHLGGPASHLSGARGRGNRDDRGSASHQASPDVG